MSRGTQQTGSSGLLHFFLSRLVEKGGSDLHLVEGHPPFIRIDGRLQPLSFQYSYLDRTHMEGILRGIFRTEATITRLYEREEIDVTIQDGGERFRTNVALAQGKIFVTIRHLKEAPADPLELGVPLEFVNIVKEEKYGVFFIVGPTGSGKSTTMASTLSYVLSLKPYRVISIEDPVEYIIPPGIGLVTQREVGRDTKSFAMGLRAAMREDPDVILVGEVRDMDTALNCFAASETGHLVLTTLHTSRAFMAPWRIVGMFPVQEQNQIRQRLVENLLGVLAQRLEPSLLKGRELKTEFLDCRSREVKELILEGSLSELERLIREEKCGWAFPE